MNRLLCFVAVLLPSSFGWCQTNSLPFHFTPVDEKLLEDINNIDLQYEKKGLVYHDVAGESYLESLAARLAHGAPPPERVEYKFRMLRDPMVNAFAMPNGSIYVNSGLIAAMESEAELASVLSHEMTHVTNRHGYLQNRSIRKKVMTINILSLTGAVPGNTAFGIALRSAAEMSQFVLMATIFGYSRQMEGEADEAGFNRLVNAGYDGAAMIGALELLDEKLEFEPVEPFWRTHPKIQERITMARALARRQTNDNPHFVNENDYLHEVAAVIRYNVTADLDSRRARTAVARAQRLVNWKPEDTRNQTLLADGYRSLGAKPPRPDGEELTKRGQSLDRTRMLKLTADEEQRGWLAAHDGKQILSENNAKAESLYREAITRDPELPEPHRGLGMLYQAQAKYGEAVREYREYLGLASPDVLDHLRIERRIEQLSSGTQGEK